MAERLKRPSYADVRKLMQKCGGDVAVCIVARRDGEIEAAAWSKNDGLSKCVERFFEEDMRDEFYNHLDEYIAQELEKGAGRETVR